MPNVTIDSQLDTLVTSLSKLRIATPIQNSNYATIKKQFQEASERLAASIDKSIDEADADYLLFAKKIEVAITSINEALRDVHKVADAIILVAKVLDVIGKVVVKLA